MDKMGDGPIFSRSDDSSGNDRQGLKNVKCKQTLRMQSHIHMFYSLCDTFHDFADSYNALVIYYACYIFHRALDLSILLLMLISLAMLNAASM